MDTGSLESNEFAAFTNLFNEWYPKSTSKKMKEVKKAKGLAGEHLGAPPYGYLRNPVDNTRWLVDEEAAAVVRRIFSLCMQEKETVSRISHSGKCGVYRLYESFKSTRLGFKSKKRIPTSKEMRAYIENAHTPIIDREVWDKVQMIRENKRRPAKSG